MSNFFHSTTCSSVYELEQSNWHYECILSRFCILTRPSELVDGARRMVRSGLKSAEMAIWRCASTVRSAARTACRLTARKALSKLAECLSETSHRIVCHKVDHIQVQRRMQSGLHSNAAHTRQRYRPWTRIWWTKKKDKSDVIVERSQPNEEQSWFSS